MFESTIRVLGGLLSAHELSLQIPGLLGASYGGELLHLAVDLAERLMPAFSTPTGLPVHRVHLRDGVVRSEKRETCTAAAGTLLVEFGALSRLTGDGRYEAVARRAVDALWTRRSKLGLMGTTIDVDSGRWIDTHSGIGAGIDSYYEYLLKGGLLLGDEELAARFEASYEAVQAHTKHGEFNIEVSMQQGKAALHSHRVSALQAFWPGLQVAYGDLAAGKASHLAFLGLWRKHQSLPELFDTASQRIVHFARDAPLRPEFVESTFHLYEATGDPHYLDVGREQLHALQNLTRVRCGFASIADVRTHKLDDRMDSYFISETLKYLWLLFDHSLEPAHRGSLFCASVEEKTFTRNETRPCINASETLFSTEVIGAKSLKRALAQLT